MTTRLYTRFSVVFACVMLLAVIVLVFNLALSSSVYAQSSEAEYLRTEAQNARAFADKQRKHAKQWLNRAEQARERAKESKRKRDKESWLDDALRYDKRAELAAIDADKAEAKAAKAEAELVQVLKILKSDPVSNPADTQPEKSASKEDKPEYPEVSLEKTIGAWRIKETDSSLVIVQEEPGSKIHGYKLEAHTADRVWKGIHTPFDEGDIRQMQDARVVFKYKPKAEEMNPEIPEWARKKIEGQLEWQIELDDAGSCSNPALSGYLFPGEVKWSKDTEGGSVKIADRGKPRPIELERVYDFELDMIGRPSLVVIMGGTHDPHLNPIEGLTKRQRFFVKVSLPKKMAEKQGKTLDVTIKGITSEEEDTITLTAGGVRKSKASINYTHSRPATIADSNDMQEEDRTAKFLSWGWWMDSTDGARLHIDAENAEGIEFRFGDMYETIPIYDSWVQRNIARLESGAWRLRGAFEAIRDSTNPKVKAEHKKNARNSLKMLNNMQTMLDSGYLSDVHKHELLVVYVSHGLVYNVPKGLDDMMKDIMQSSYFIEENRQSLTTGKKMLTGFFEGMTGKDLSSKIPLAIKAVGTNWVADGEKFLARRNLKKASKSIEDQAMDELVPALAYGLYDGVVMTSGAGELYLIGNAIFGSRSRDHTGKKRTGPTDHMGRKRTWTDVVLTSVGLASGTVLGMHGGTAWSRFNDRNIGITIGGKGSPIKFRMNRLGAPVKTKRVFRGDFKPLYPKTLRPAQLTQVRLKRPPGYEVPQKAAAGKVAAPGVRGGTVKKYDPGVDRWLKDTETVESFYDVDGDIVDPLNDRVARKQCYEDCNIRSDTYVHERHGKKPKNSVEAYTQMKKANLLDGQGLYQGKNPLQKGFPNKLSREFNELNGFQTIEVPAHANASMTLDEIANMKKVLKADDVKVVLAVGNMDAIETARKSGADISYHAVVIHDFKRKANGIITHVQFFDPAVGRIVELPACACQKRLAKHTAYANTTLYFAPEKVKPTIMLPKKKKKPFIEWSKGKE